jgi:threonine aldolase
VFFRPDRAGVSATDMVAALNKRGVQIAVMDGRIRACTHLDVSAAMIEEMLGLVREIVRKA